MQNSLASEITQKYTNNQPLETLLNTLEKSLSTNPDAHATRDSLEVACLYAIRIKDIVKFKFYWQILQPYYDIHSLPVSQRMNLIVALNLLSLIANNNLAEFHLELELVKDRDNIYIKHPIQLEQCLMEGSYSKILNSRSNVPAQEYLFFVDILFNTIRAEIANSCEKAYLSLPLADAASLLYFKSPEELSVFIKEVCFN